VSATRRWSARLAPGLAALALACSRHRPPPTAPAVSLGPAVEVASPAPRAMRVPLDAPIWARFRTALDPATVGPTTVFLKLDATRIASAISYDGPTRTLHVVPLVPLRLNHTYTVELSPKLAAADGTALDSTYFWQFTMTSVRLLRNPVPADGASARSPFEALGWDRTEADGGPARYQVWVSTDSSAVRARTVTPTVTTEPYRVAPARCAPGTTQWWGVRTTNLATGETTDSPLWHFGVVDAGAAIDSLALAWSSYTSVRASSPNSPNCSSTSMTVGGSTLAAVGWNMGSGPPDARLAGARIVLNTTNYNVRTDNSIVHGITAPLDGCTARYSGPPYRDVLNSGLAAGTFYPNYMMVTFESDRLTAHVQCALAFGAPSGYSFSADYAYTIYSPVIDGLRPTLWVYYYRDPPGAPVATVHRAAP
jgi:hypothetical protein